MNVDDQITRAIANNDFKAGIAYLGSKAKSQQALTYVDCSVLRMMLLSINASSRENAYKSLLEVRQQAPNPTSKFQISCSLAECSVRSDPNYKAEETKALLESDCAAVKSSPATLDPAITTEIEFLYQYYYAALIIPDMFNVPYIQLSNADDLSTYIESYHRFGKAVKLEGQNGLDLWHLITLASVARQNLILAIIGSDFLGGMDPALPYVASLEPNKINFKSIIAREDVRFREYRRQYEKIRPRGTRIVAPESALKQPPQNK